MILKITLLIIALKIVLMMKHVTLQLENVTLGVKLDIKEEFVTKIF